MSLYIGNLSSRIRRDELERVFQRFGQCDVRLKDGYGFVVYEFPPNAEKALRALEKKHICGEALNLSWSNKQPRQFNRLARAGGRSYEPQHSRDSVKGKLGSNVLDYRTSVKQSDGFSKRSASTNMRDKEVMYDKNRAKDNFGDEHSGYREEFLGEGGRFESDRVENDRWGEQLHYQLNENGLKNDVVFERYEPCPDYERKYDSGVHQLAYRGGSPALRRPQKDIGRDNSNEVNLKCSRDANFQATCYQCGGSGHKMRNCPQESSSLRNSTRSDPRHDDRRGSGGSERRRFGSRSQERSSRDSMPKRLLKNDTKSSSLGKDQKSIWNGSSPVGNETDKSLKTHDGGNKRSRKEIESPKGHDTKKTRRSFSSSLHSRSHSSSQSLEHVKRSCSHSRSRARLLSSKSRSTSRSHYTQSKSCKSMARTSSHTSLSVSLGQPLPSSSNKAQLNLKGSSDNVTTPESKEILTEKEQPVEGDNGLEEAKVEKRIVAVNSEIGVTPPQAEIEMEKGQPLEKDTEDHQMASCSLYEVSNISTVAVEKGTVDNGGSPKSLVEMNCQDSDKLTTELAPVQMKNPDSDPSISLRSGHSLSISSEELHLVIKHYYGHDLQNENQRHLPADAYFGSARLWPWEIIYYRRLKKGPISVENYARRLDQNREFGVVDKYIRSSSGWEELTQEN
ncbi:serine/arginine-rich splicing factor 4 [Ricinus communis]|uniref:serine/arginine-rich splicing factor 4 n=1 Tax=Ricinus communis TaxID=3988 RepID=UPI00201A6C9A|nr:serine/arginine-rich splicing factor 4 [Ricinus communis]